MTSASLKDRQTPLKDRYRAEPEAALITLSTEGHVGAGVTCRLDTHKAMIVAGLHPATGGSSQQACSGDMLLEALVACAGVTLAAVATSLSIDIEGAKVRAEGDLDFRGTLGVSKDAPVGFRAIRLVYAFPEAVSDADRATLVKLGERYCVVYQTLTGNTNLSAHTETVAA